MIITNLTSDSKVYSSNAYYIQGDHCAIPDINSLVDAGSGPTIIENIESAKKGAGKKRLEIIVVTHTHSDHFKMAQSLKERYNAKIMAFNQGKYVDIKLRDGNRIRMGDSEFVVIHTPGHSFDSICLYNTYDNVLFSGDMPLQVYRDRSTCADYLVESFKRLSELDIKIIYPGHGPPITSDVNNLIHECYSSALRSRYCQK